MAEAILTSTDPHAAAMAVVGLERAILVTAADRIARAPSLAVKRFFCRSVWASARHVQQILQTLPPTVATIAGDIDVGPFTRRLMATWGATVSESAFLVAFRRIIAPLAAGVYEAATRTGDQAAELCFRRVRLHYERLASADPSPRDHENPCALDGELRALAELARDYECEAVVSRTRAATARSRPPLYAPAREYAIRALRCGEAREDVWFVSDAADYRRYLHQLVAFEINTFEACSRHIAEFAWMPWEFHWDMARQIRDELRHLEMWLERLPHAGGMLGEWPLGLHEFAICAGHDLPGRVALLERLVEAAALDGLDLNRCLWESRGDRVMVAYLRRVQDDEIGHVRRGNKWIRWLCADDAEIAAVVDRAEEESRRRILAAARELEQAGIVESGNGELVRRKFADVFALDVNRTARARAGFSKAEIAREVARRRARITGMPGDEEIR